MNSQDHSGVTPVSDVMAVTAASPSDTWSSFRDRGQDARDFTAALGVSYVAKNGHHRPDALSRPHQLSGTR